MIKIKSGDNLITKFNETYQDILNRNIDFDIELNFVKCKKDDVCNNEKLFGLDTSSPFQIDLKTFTIYYIEDSCPNLSEQERFVLIIHEIGHAVYKLKKEFEEEVYADNFASSVMGAYYVSSALEKLIAMRNPIPFAPRDIAKEQIEKRKSIQEEKIKAAI